MNKKNFTEEEITSLLNELGSESVEKIVKRYGVAEDSIYEWREAFCLMNKKEINQINKLAEENIRLHKMLAHCELVIEQMKTEWTAAKSS